ncbi:adenylate/guanylate cyclase domain-containing protein [Rossellomorea sp. NRS-1567]|uniref:adenylate/guanylate cyclase domain-containing protein n=1 Tax=Rossellomorea sp. NRS-1567 TaxID=3233901 RepID=UPI003D26F7C9
MKEQLEAEVKEILDWKIDIKKEEKSVPGKGDLTLGETAKSIETCILFVDIRGSSIITDTHRKATTIKIFNAFLNGVVRIAKANWGHVRSFNGDSLLIIFDPDMPNIVSDKAVDTALKIKGFVREILLPALKKKQYEEKFEVGIGIAKDNIVVSKVGIRGTENNDLIWASTGTNMAAKLGNSGSDIMITEKVFYELGHGGLYTEDANDKKEKYMWSKETLEFANKYYYVHRTSWYRFCN